MITNHVLRQFKGVLNKKGEGVRWGKNLIYVLKHVDHFETKKLFRDLQNFEFGCNAEPPASTDDVQSFFSFFEGFPYHVLMLSYV